MDTIRFADWEETVRTSLGRGGQLLAMVVAIFLVAVYMCGGQLLENPAKLVIGGFFIGSMLDFTVSTTWRHWLAVKF